MQMGMRTGGQFARHLKTEFTMNPRGQFNRIGNLFNDGAERTQEETGHWADEGAKRARAAARRVRDQVDAGTRNVASVEEAIVRHMRENPVAYFLAVALVIVGLIARLMLESRRTRRTPPL
jgi:hypothetical protein